MKPQTKKKLFVLIIMMFSISFIHAQCSDNKIQLCKATRGGYCLFACVAKNQVQKYYHNGWNFICPCSFYIVKSKIKESSSPKIIANSAMLSKKNSLKKWTR